MVVAVNEVFVIYVLKKIKLNEGNYCTWGNGFK